jgi:uncharacterized Tic20 family protein
MDFGNYGFVLGVHSTLRWLVVVAGLVATVAAWSGRLGSRSWADSTTAAGRVFALAMDLQFVVGAVLYTALSPAVAASMRNAANAMQDAQQRFWMVEHPAAMILALVFAHVGVIKAKRPAGSDAHRQAARYFTLALLLVLAALPWPFLTHGRPLLPSW